MRLPRTSRRGQHELKELALGRGDYVVGGARSLPFLDLDGARRRRPLVFGEVTDDLGTYPPLAAGMFSGRQNDPLEWAVMWKEIGADGVCVRIRKSRGDDALGLVEGISDRTGLPLAVFGCGDNSVDVPLMESIASRISDAVIIVGCNDAAMCSELAGKVGMHVLTARGDDIGDAIAASGTMGCDTILFPRTEVLGGDLLGFASALEDARQRGLDGDPGCGVPIMADVTSSWDAPGALEAPDECSAIRKMSMWEAESALVAMMHGADLIVVRGPGAADMARVYGEELADL